jgi:hypothetical protein
VSKKTRRPYRKEVSVVPISKELLEDLLRDYPDRDKARFRKIALRKIAPTITKPRSFKRSISVSKILAETPTTIVTPRANVAIIKSINEGLKDTKQSMKKLEINVNQRNRLVDTLSQSAGRA